jgi:hypothetical protein
MAEQLGHLMSLWAASRLTYAFAPQAGQVTCGMLVLELGRPAGLPGRAAPGFDR